ncbi:MAG: DinB family protein [Acidobacteria bacterium]|nr:MAG: DinB family protein [Acidobacteriota bacterium]PYY11723.1 MAG: DinB family protein [Acidobacteriota bacterium]
MKTATVAIAPPETSEYAPYYSRYISLVESHDILATLQKQVQATQVLLSSLSEQQANLRYAPDKWSIKQVLGHLIDSERIFAYRALRIARADQIPMEGFEQDDYVRGGNFESRSLSDLLEEYETVRAATLTLFRNLDAAAWSRRGVANNNQVTVRAVAYIIAGHELHHMQIVRNRYLPG